MVVNICIETIAGETYCSVQGRWLDIPDVVEEITIGAQFTDDHNRSLLRVLRNAHPKLCRNIRYSDHAGGAEHLRIEQCWDDRNHPVV